MINFDNFDIEEYRNNGAVTDVYYKDATKLIGREVKISSNAKIKDIHRGEIGIIKKIDALYKWPIIVRWINDYKEWMYSPDELEFVR